jgi:hypothetical protein
MHLSSVEDIKILISSTSQRKRIREEDLLSGKRISSGISVKIPAQVLLSTG